MLYITPQGNFVAALGLNLSPTEGCYYSGYKNSTSISTISNRLASCRVATVDSNEVSEDARCAIKT